MKIEATKKFIASHKQGSIHATKEQIVKVLGFKPNVDDDPSKVVNSWGFTIDGEDAAIWDWKGSEYFNEFSYFNPKVPELFRNPEKFTLSVTRRTTHLAGSKRTSQCSIHFLGGNIILFAK